jgi:hypothetical protein
MSDEEAILDEAKDNHMEAAQRIKATQHRLWSAGLDEDPNYRNLSHRTTSALAMTEAAFLDSSKPDVSTSERGKVASVIHPRTYAVAGVSKWA